MSIIWLVLILFIFPVLLGRLIAQQSKFPNWRSLALVFPLGFFSELCILEIIAVPITLLHGMTTTLVTIFLVFMFVCSFLSLYLSGIRINLSEYKKLHATEYILLLIFLGLLLFQIYKSITTDFTWTTYDDFYYVTLANDAVYSNQLFDISFNGVGMSIQMGRILQSSLLYPSILSILTGYSVVLVEHCILQVYYLILAYVVYYYLSSVLFSKFFDRLAFLVLICLLYLYGHYSSYNTTFRLLMPNYQGKAILAVSLTPFYFSVMIELLGHDYNWKHGIVLMILSVSAVALTLIGAIVSIACVCIPIVFSMISKKREAKYLWYIPMACTFSVLAATELLLSRLLV